MAQLDDIRQGMAALLRTVLPTDEGQVSAYLEASPSTPCLQVAGVAPNGIEGLNFDAPTGPHGIRWLILVEGVMGLVSDIGAQKILNEWLSDDSLTEALESDSTGSGALFSRLLDDGTILSGQSAAAQSIGFSEYRGQSPFTLRDGREVLLATWVFEVVT